MSRRSRVVAGLALVTMLAALIPLGQAFARGGTSIGPIGMDGDQEVPGPGDANGTGTANLNLDVATERVCFDLDWQRIGRPFAAHIHKGRPGVAGPIRVTLFAASRPLPGTIRAVSGCVRHVDPGLIQKIIDNPQRYYVNVHNKTYPAGAIRGDLVGTPA
ncbi:MAG: CHRD domain-containing protein [Actinomycetota bacterium]